MIRTAWVLSAGALLTFVLASGVVIGSLFPSSIRRRTCEGLPRLWSRTILRWSGAEVRIDGLERVDWSRPMVLVANHQSWFDVFALVATLPARFRFIAKEELSRIPIFGRAWRACGHVSVNRRDRDDAIASLDRASDQIREEALAVIFFPEGTRSPDGRLQRFKKGAFVMAIQTGTPVVPVGISGSREVMPKGSFRIRSGRIRLEVGDPIPTSSLEHADRNALLTRSREEVARLMRRAGGKPDGSDGLQPGSEEGE